ncbi:MAG: hypothetical protein P8N09_09375 [Planctomycetota bacterium]|nr:hypothetical protein [Planctomycetota bacterium]
MSDHREEEARSADVPVTPGALQEESRGIEGVRRLHLELAERFEAGEALRIRMDQMRDGLDDLRMDQSRLRHDLERRQGRRFTILVVLLGGMLAGAFAWERWAHNSSKPDTSSAQMAAMTLSQGEMGDALSSGEGVESLWSAETLDSMSEDDVRDLWVHALKTEQRLDSVREERGKQLGEIVRLRQDVMQKQMRLDEMVQTVSSAAALAEARRDEPISVSRTIDREPAPLITGLNTALTGSGLPYLQVLEAGHVEGDLVMDLILREEDRLSGISDVYSMKSLRLLVNDGQVCLELTGFPSESEPLAETVLHSLDVWDAAAWEAVGMVVPTGFIPVGVAKKSLEQLLEYQPFEVVSLGGFRDGMLHDIVLRQLGPSGEVLRVYSAPTGVVLVEGPELVLHDGVVTEGDVDRPFWKGQSRLPLPGSNYAVWAEIAGG